ncbi:NFX1-type zinc finger-containing protein 1 isoform X1 [Drosophila tropicalis]|uniref:NFX1-type zinc finger-containing protein 1 isoform X1 n=1 Tax=Drosophila tropicalis TaxID=46794 RepID=UPI0035ABF236
MSDSDDDWFSKDPEKIEQNVQEHVKRQRQDETEHIKIRDEDKMDNYLKQLSLDASAADLGCGIKSTDRFTTGEFGVALKKPPIDIFLYFMSEGRDLFSNQLNANDSHKRLLQLVAIFKSLCQLELGGFDEQFLREFTQQTVLMDMFKRYVLRLLTNSPKAKWNPDCEPLLNDMKWLMIRAHKLGVLRNYDVVDLFKKLIAECAMPQDFKNDFARQLNEFDAVFGNAKDDIYPTLDKLLCSTVDVEKERVNRVPSLNDVHKYINKQRQTLCDDFTIPLWEFVQRLRGKSDINALEQQGLLWNTRLKENTEFAKALRHSLIFVDLRPNENDKSKKLTIIEQEFVNNIKTGSLLCFTTGYEFENLLLASVTYTDPEQLRQGYLSVEIIKQHNIGNIYGKQLHMFQTPVFFEPYLRVHNYLSTCSAHNFPMCRYIVDGVLETQSPAYLKGQLLEVDRKLFKELPLNEMQKKAIQSVLTNEFCLIQGPPGTGKTHVSVQLVKALIQNSKQLKTGPIIVLTYTNESLDKFLINVAKYTDEIIRFGSQSRDPAIAKFNVRTMVDPELVPPRLKHVWWLISCEYKEQFEHLQKLHNNFDGSEPSYQTILKEQLKLQKLSAKLNTLQVIFQYYLARDKDLLAMTTTCAARLNFLFRLLQSKCVLFEEAAEIQEAHILACLTPFTEHVIQIGDHKQLQPFTGSNKHQQISMFERLIKGGFPATVLNMQYRMRPNIAQILVPSFYDELFNAANVEAYEEIRCLTKNLFFLQHNQPEHQLSDMSIENEYEAAELVKLTEFLIKRGKYKPIDIVILSPYNAQVDRIKRTLPKSLRSEIKVSSVDSYQGLECNIVLLSLVRSNSNGQIGFLRQPNRVCVALSRARWGLYIVGDIETLQRGNRELWGRICQQLNEGNAIGEKFPKQTNFENVKI